MEYNVQLIQAIQNTQRRIAITIGIIMGVTLSTYFFTFAMLIDRGITGMLVFEAVSSVLFIVAYIFLNRISFAVTRLRYQRSRPHDELIQQMKPGDINIPAEQLITTLRQSV